MSKLLLIFLLFSSFISAQILFKSLSLESDVDVKSIALGESFTANPDEAFSADHNPANIAWIKNVVVSASYRDFTWYKTTEMNFYGAAIILPTSIGNFSFMYKSYRIPELEFSSVEFPAGFITTINDKTFILAYSRQIIPNLSVGINLKTFNLNDIEETDLSGNKTLIEFSHPVVADIGALYSFNSFTNSTRFSDKLLIGTVLQNYGTDYGFTYNGVHEYLKTSRFVKAGLSYVINFLRHEQSNYVSLMLSAEYKKMLNSPDLMLTPDKPDDKYDFWGFGVESKIMDIFALRFGGVVYPYNSVFSRSENGAGFRYGLGLDLPFRKLRINSPLTLVINYAYQPIYGKGADMIYNHINAFDFSIKYGL